MTTPTEKKERSQNNPRTNREDQPQLPTGNAESDVMKKEIQKNDERKRDIKEHHTKR